MGESLKEYTIDTNVFRHETNENDGADLRLGAHTFWTKVKEEIENEEAVLFVPKEAIRELEAQSFTLSDKQNRKINGLLELCIEVEPDNLSPDIEQAIKKMSAYIRAKHRNDLNQPKIEYGKVSDARILYTAYKEDSILVTANIKDFLLYPLLFPQDEQWLYNMKTNTFVEIPEAGYDNIHASEKFQELLQEFYELDQELGKA